MNTTIKSILFVLIWALIFIGLSGIIPLVRDEIASGHACPKIFTIPACYVILACLVLVIIGKVKHKPRIYFIGAGIGVIIAAIGSIANSTGSLSCPQSSMGIPLCYLSFALFSSLLILNKLLSIQNRKA